MKKKYNNLLFHLGVDFLYVVPSLDSLQFENGTTIVPRNSDPRPLFQPK